MFRPRRARSKKRRRRWFQFSLRGLLVLVALTAAACAWWLRPETRQSPLAGGILTLREQLRTSADGSAAVGYVRWWIDTPEGEPVARGGYLEEWSHGRWSGFYADGRLAIRGTCSLGEPVGTWRSWSSDATRLAETRLDRGDASQSGSVRFWWANGQPRMECQLRGGREHGASSGYDPRGRRIVSGTSHQGRRQGWWSFTDPDRKTTNELYYANDLPMPEIEDHLARLRRMLSAEDLADQISAACALQRLGAIGVAPLTEALDQPDETRRVLALRALGRMGDDAMTALPEIRKHLDAESPLVRLHASLAAFMIDVESRSLYRERLMAALDRAEPHVALDAMLRVFDADAESGAAIFRRVLLLSRHEDPEVADSVFTELGVKPGLVTPLLEHALDDPDVSVRRRVLDLMMVHRGSWSALELWGEDYRDVLQRAFHKASEDPDPEIRRRATEILFPPRGSGFGSGGFF